MIQRLKNIASGCGVLAISLVSLAAQPALAQTCPQDLCACLGAAGHYGVVATNSIKLVSSKLTQSDGSGGKYVTPFPASVDDSVCATVGSFAGIRAETPGDDDAQLGADAILLNPTGKVAATFVGYKVAKVLTPAVSVAGDLVTGGGTIKGAAAATITGATDTSGTSAKLPGCQQALSDFKSASATLQALTATQTIATTKIRQKGTDLDINVGAGTNVINLTSISLSPQVTKSYGYAYAVPATVNINLLPTTAVVIINVAKTVKIGKSCAIAVLGGDPNRVIINAYGAKSSVGIAADASVDPMVLVANGGITVGRGAAVGNLFGKKITLRGAASTTNLACP